MKTSPGGSNGSTSAGVGPGAPSAWALGSRQAGAADQGALAEGPVAAAGLAAAPARRAHARALGPRRIGHRWPPRQPGGMGRQEVLRLLDTMAPVSCLAQAARLGLVGDGGGGEGCPAPASGDATENLGVPPRPTNTPLAPPSAIPRGSLKPLSASLASVEHCQAPQVPGTGSPTEWWNARVPKRRKGNGDRGF